MVVVQVRYVTKRVKPSGLVMWYWQRPGHKLVRLRGSEIARVNLAAKLNAAADAKKKGEVPVEPDHGTVAWVIAKYKESDGYLACKPSTHEAYKGALDFYGERWGWMPFADIDQSLVLDLCDSLSDRKPKRDLYIAVLSNLYKTARRRKAATVNPTEDLDLSHAKPRQELFSEEDIDAFVKACLSHVDGPLVLRAFWLLLYTAQRPSDVLAMTWKHWNDGTIRVRQQKTGTLVDIWCHRDLREVLEAAKRQAKGTHIVTLDDGQPVPYGTFNKRFVLMRELANLPTKQARDLRRTAVTNLADAGCTENEIAAVSGHTIEQTRRILSTYLVRTATQAKNAILKLENTGRLRKID